MRHTAADAATPDQRRASTGIAGLDTVLGGGLPADHLYLVEGAPGTGKTTLGLQFLLKGIEDGEKALYITLSETASELRTVARSHGWSTDKIEIFELMTQEGLSPESEQSILHPSEVELGETTRSIMAAAERIKPGRVVFDSLSEMRLLAQNPLRYRRQVLALKTFLSTRNCTVLLLDDLTSTHEDLQLQSIAHGVIILEQYINAYGPERRRMRVVKMRGIPYRGGEHDIRLATGGMQVFPRLEASQGKNKYVRELVSTGSKELDKLLGGGLARGSNMLFTGPSGVGKTTTAISCMRARLMAGEKAAYFLFDENLGTLFTRARALGLDVEPFLSDGQLEIRTLDPAEVSPGEFAAMVSDVVDRGATTVVIDSLNAYLQAMPGDKHLVLQMHEILTHLNHRGVVTMLVLAQHGLLGDVRHDVDLSYLSDGILLFRFFEARGSLLKAVSVVKSRASHHELTIREFRLAAEGVQVGAALTDFEGVMSGVASYKGDHPLLSDSDSKAG
ncbi:MAG TPA: ATPase domain-containing protein [Ramlibacter sp.]|nr:ATPase domain-containing protein [Ramlibacter sp.]